MVLGNANKRKGSSSSSRRVTRYVSTRLPSGRTITSQETPSHTQMLKKQSEEREAARTRLEAMKASGLEQFAALNEGWEDMDDDQDVTDMSMALTGATLVNLSHVGGEFAACAEQLLGDPKRSRKRHPDHRNRRDRNERRTKAFEQQLPALVDSYMAWNYSRADKGGDADSLHPSYDTSVKDCISIRRVDIFSSSMANIELLEDDKLVNCALIRQGLLPCAPFSPSAAITLRTLEFFRVAHLRCPRLSIHSFVQTLCDLHGTPFAPYLSRQFSICHDLHLAILEAVKQRVMVALGRHAPFWRLANCCPACTYTLKDEKKLKFSMLYTVDGNDSLKRIIRREQLPESATSIDGNPVLGPSKEAFDSRQAGNGMYLTRGQVDLWSAESLASIVPTYKEEDPEDDNPCVERWRNMKSEVTARMWGVFEESGLFLSLCRHGFVLLLADMIRSGEQSKYPLSIVDKMLEVFGNDLAMGYDIGCRFDTTLKKCPQLGSKVKSKNHTCLVGAFHGHAHNRLCQSRYLATYVEGLGLEDLEGCERFFGKSNDLAACTRYASEFHRRQAIVSYCTHNDTFETYQNLSKFLLNNYKQALGILDTRPAVAEAMAKLGVTDKGVFEAWLKEEEEYLKNLKNEPLEETLEMEYYTELLKLADSMRNLSSTIFIIQTPADITRRDTTQAMETARRHALETRDRCIEKVQALEVRMGIRERWTPGCAEWTAAAEKVAMRRYQQCIDRLEGLVVARMFELTKMNQSHTGYKLRKHIGNALKSRSQAIRQALTKYNEAAAELQPPRPTLQWEEVVEYAFLADFDLLRATRQDIRLKPWATPAARLTMDAYFKLQRAEEEIKRLNVEVARLATYIRDEDSFLCTKELSYVTSNPLLSHAIAVYRLERGRFNHHHRKNIQKIYALQGFTGSSALGVRSDQLRPGALPLTTLPPPNLNETFTEDSEILEGDDDTEAALQEEQEDEDEEATVLHAMHEVYNVAFDSNSSK